MKTGSGKRPRRRGRAYIRRALLLMLIGLLLCAAGPLYAFLATNFSGQLALHQRISAAELVRGFEFGPVYLEQGRAERYFISALLPSTPEGVWHTTFEVLNVERKPVFKQDELRFTGEYQFQPGQHDTYNKVFRLDEGPGYYYFRYTALNGRFDANPAAPPVVEFSVRQGVIDGIALWAPAFGAMALGLFTAMLGVMLLYRVGARRSDGRSAEAEAAPGSQRGLSGGGMLPTR